MTKLSPKMPSVVERPSAESRNGRKEAADTDADAADTDADAADTDAGAADTGAGAADTDLEAVVMASGVSLAGLRAGVRLQRLTTQAQLPAREATVDRRAGLPARTGRGARRAPRRLAAANC